MSSHHNSVTVSALGDGGGHTHYCTPTRANVESIAGIVLTAAYGYRPHGRRPHRSQGNNANALLAGAIVHTFIEARGAHDPRVCARLLGMLKQHVLCATHANVLGVCEQCAACVCAVFGYARVVLFDACKVGRVGQRYMPTQSIDAAPTIAQATQRSIISSLQQQRTALNYCACTRYRLDTLLRCALFSVIGVLELDVSTECGCIYRINPCIWVMVC